MRNPFTESAVRCTSAQEFLHEDAESTLRDLQELCNECGFGDQANVAPLSWEFTPAPPDEPLEVETEVPAHMMAQPVTPGMPAPETPLSDPLSGTPATPPDHAVKFLERSSDEFLQAPRTPPLVPPPQRCPPSHPMCLSGVDRLQPD